MKKILSLLVFTLLAAAVVQGQQPAPGILNYQGVARNSVGNVLVNKTISLRLTIRDGSAAGPAVYAETRTVTTNPFGLFNVQLGSTGFSSQTGTIAGVPWGVGLKYIQVEIDPNGGSSFINIGTAQLASVPYSLYSSLSNDLVLPFNKTQADAGTLFKITNSGTGSGSTALEGLTNSTAANAFAIIGTVTSTSPGGFSAGVRGINNGTGGLGIGVYGSQAGSGWGVYGTTPSGIGVHGATNTGWGVYGLANGTGTGVYGISSTGNAGRFEVSNAANTAAVLAVNSNNPGDGVQSLKTGTAGKAGYFENTNATNGSEVLQAVGRGTGNVGSIVNLNAASNASTLLVTTNSSSNTALTVRGPDIWGSAIGINNTVSGMEWRMNVQGTRFQITKIPGSTFTPFQLFDDGQVEFPSTAGAHRVRILDNGNVGIGTTTPTYKLNVVHGGGTGVGVRSTASFSVTDIDAFSGDAALRFAANGTFQWNIRNQPGTNNLEVFEMGSASRMILQDATGNLGINVPAPAYRLDVDATGAGSNGARIRHTSSFATLDVLGVGTDQAFRFGKNGALWSGINTLPDGDHINFFKFGAGQNLMSLNVNTGNLGVGGFPAATNAAAKVHVRGFDATNNTYAPPSGFTGATGLAAMDNVSTPGIEKWGMHTFVNGSSLINHSIFAVPGTTGIVNTGLFARVSAAPTGGTSHGLYAFDAINNGTTTWAATILGRMRYADGTQGAGNFLVSDAAGNASWTPIVPGGLSGAGTLNFIPKWTPNGVTLGNSLLFDDGSQIGLGTTTPAYRFDVLHGGSTGIRIQSAASFSVLDIDAASGDAALRFANAGVNQWNIRNRPADNYLEIFELGGGGSRVVIQDGTGNVGIGQTVSPSYKLDVLHGGSTGIRVQSSASFSVLDIDAATGDAAIRLANAGVNQWNIRNQPGTDNLQVFELGGGGERMHIENTTGNVSIGGSAPTHRLHVFHGGSTGVKVESAASFSVVDIDAASGDAALRFQNAGVGQWNTRNRPADNYYEIFELGGGGSRVVIQDGTGNVGIGQTVSPSYKLDVLHGGSTGARIQSNASFSVLDIDAATGDAALRFANAGVNQWNIRNQPGTDNLQVFELGGGGERMHIENTTGNVSIGGSAPTHRLHVFHAGSTGVKVESSASFSVVDIDAASGDAALRFGNAGVNQWNVRNQPGTDNLQFFEFGGGGERMILEKTTGRMGVSISTPTARVDVGGVTGTLNEGLGITNKTVASTWYLYSSSTGNMFIGKASNLGSFDGVTGVYTALSDGRLKSNVKPLESVLPKLMSLDAKRYEYKYNNPSHAQSIGFIAQDIQKVFPEFVRVNKDDEGNPMVKNQLTLDYSGLSVLAIKAVQEQQETIQQLATVRNGNVVTDNNGRAVVNLDSKFIQNASDFKYQLTVMDETQFAQVRIAKKISGSVFEIVSDKPGIEISWQVTGTPRMTEAASKIDASSEYAGDKFVFEQNTKPAARKNTPAVTGGSIEDVTPKAAAKPVAEPAQSSLNYTAPATTAKAAEASGSVVDAPASKPAAKAADQGGSIEDDVQAAKPATKTLGKDGSISDEAVKPAAPKVVPAPAPVRTENRPAVADKKLINPALKGTTMDPSAKPVATPEKTKEVQVPAQNSGNTAPAEAPAQKKATETGPSSTKVATSQGE